MRRWGILRGKEDNLLKDLKETTLSFKKLGKKYGVSRQAVYVFYKSQKIKRPKRPQGHQPGECRLCQKLIQMSNKPQSEFLSLHTIVKKMGASMERCRHHLRTLRKKGLVGKKFGRLLSKRAEKAYAIYFTKRLPMRTIGAKVGLKNFCSVLKRHRAVGFNIPPPLYVYNRHKRGMIQRGMQGRKQG